MITSLFSLATILFFVPLSLVGISKFKDENDDTFTTTIILTIYAVMAIANAIEVYRGN